MTVRGELLLQIKKPEFEKEESDHDDTVVLGETWCTDSEGTLSDSDNLELMRVIVVSLNLRDHQLKEGAIQMECHMLCIPLSCKLVKLAHFEVLYLHHQCIGI